MEIFQDNSVIIHRAIETLTGPCMHSWPYDLPSTPQTDSKESSCNNKTGTLSVNLIGNYPTPLNVWNLRRAGKHIEDREEQWNSNSLTLHCQHSNLDASNPWTWIESQRRVTVSTLTHHNPSHDSPPLAISAWRGTAPVEAATALIEEPRRVGCLLLPQEALARGLHAMLQNCNVAPPKKYYRSDTEGFSAMVLNLG